MQQVVSRGRMLRLRSTGKAGSRTISPAARFEERFA